MSRWLLGGLMLTGVGICCANVVARYFFGQALFWAEEVMVFLTIWGVFVGAATAAYERTHLNMDFFSNRFPQAWLRALNLAVVAALLACCGFMLVQSWEVVTLLYRGGMVSVSAGVPKWIPQLALPAGFALMAAAVLGRFNHYVSGK